MTHSSTPAPSKQKRKHSIHGTPAITRNAARRWREFLRRLDFLLAAPCPSLTPAPTFPYLPLEKSQGSTESHPTVEKCRPTVTECRPADYFRAFKSENAALEFSLSRFVHVTNG